MWPYPSTTKNARWCAYRQSHEGSINLGRRVDTLSEDSVSHNGVTLSTSDTMLTTPTPGELEDIQK
jgi:hypothetical protein